MICEASISFAGSGRERCRVNASDEFLSVSSLETSRCLLRTAFVLVWVNSQSEHSCTLQTPEGELIVAFDTVTEAQQCIQLLGSNGDERHGKHIFLTDFISRQHVAAHDCVGIRPKRSTGGRRHTLGLFACCHRNINTDLDEDGEVLDQDNTLDRAQPNKVPIVYQGQWRLGFPEGKGWAIFGDDSRYEGEWHQGVFHGQGRWRSADHSVYEGEWEAGRFHGNGNFSTIGGISYSGQWVKGCKHGQGKFAYGNESSYSGEWNYDQRHGQGVQSCVWKGTEFVGSWHGDRQCGKGKWSSEIFTLQGYWYKNSQAEVELCSVPGHSEKETEAHLLTKQLPAASGPWKQLFIRAHLEYDATAKRIDASLVQALSRNSLSSTAEPEADIIAEHLLPMLSKSEHPYGVLLHQFCEIFHGAFRPGWQAAAHSFESRTAEVLQHAVADLRSFLTGMRSFIFETTKEVLNTKQKRLEAHSILVDVLYRMVYDCIWALYTTVWHDDDHRLARNINALSSVTCYDLGVKPKLCLSDPQRAQATSRDVPAEAASSPPKTPSKRRLQITIPSSPNANQGSPPPAKSLSIPAPADTVKTTMPSELKEQEHKNSIADPECGVLLPPPSPMCNKSMSVNSSPETSPPHVPYWDAIFILRSLPEYQSPAAKIECLKCCVNAIFRAIEEFHSHSEGHMAVGAEDKFPILLYVIVKARVPMIRAEVALMADALDERARNVSEAGYRVTELEAALKHLSNMEVDTYVKPKTDIGQQTSPNSIDIIFESERYL